MSQIIKARFCIRNMSANEWTVANPVLMRGEAGLEYDTNKIKIGDGINPWANLNYVTSGSGGGGAPVRASSGVYNAPTMNDFPSVGLDDIIYKAANTNKIYQWVNDPAHYECLNEISSNGPGNRGEIAFNDGRGKIEWKPLVETVEVYSAPSFQSFPKIGNKSVLYKDEQKKELYQWDEFADKYYPLGVATLDRGTKGQFATNDGNGKIKWETVINRSETGA